MDPKWKLFNGSSVMITRIIEALIIAAVVGGVSVWGNSKVMDIKMEHLCEKVSDIKFSINKLGEKFDHHMEAYHWGNK